MTPRGLAALKSHEGLRLTAYKDTGGTLTIGWGSTRGVKEGDVITLSEAEGKLADDLVPVEAAIHRLVKVPLSDSEFDSLCLFIFNVGVSAFEGSTLLRKLNDGLYDQVPGELMKWVHDNGRVVSGLVNRRKAEVELWNS